jgi:hypothetical protein
MQHSVKTIRTSSRRLPTSPCGAGVFSSTNPAFRKLGLAVLVLFLWGTALAQNPPNPLSVSGTVFDPSGASTPDATVILKQGSGQVRSSVKTDPSGGFRFDAVRPGNYSIQVQHEGFKTSVVQVKVSAQRIEPLKIVLALQELVSEVSVNESELTQVSTDIAENLNAATAGQDILEQIPVFDQDYVAAMSAFLDAGAIGTSGPQMIVNGVEVSSVIASPSTIQEVRINQNPYSAEFARPGRGTIEIITKDPGSAYHGTLNFIFRDSVFNARDPFAKVRAPEQRRIWEGALGGPVGHSKSTSFLISGHRQEEDFQSTVFAEGLSGPIQESVPSPRRDNQLTVRLGHQFTPSHSSFLQYSEWDYPSTNQGIGGFVLPEAGTNLNQWERELNFNDRLAPSPKWLFQSQLLIGVERHSTTSVNSAPKTVVNGAFTSGGAQINLLNTEYHASWNEVVSWSSGKHLVKFGVSVPDWSRRGAENRNNFGGTYYFDSLQNYSAQLPYAFKQQQGSGKLVYWQKELGAFVQDDYRLRPNLSVSLGLRYNWQNLLNSNTQFAPRFAFAYSPDKKRKTVLRGGAGVFYDRTGPGPLTDRQLFNGQVLQSFLLIDPPYPNPFANRTGTPASDIVLFAPSIREPYSIQYSFGVERQVSKRTTIAATYSGSRAISLFRSRDINAPLAPDYLMVPNPALGFVRQIESAGRQAGNSLDITVRGVLTHRLTGLMQYTLSRTDNNTGGVNWYPANQFDPSGEWGLADFDQRHRLNMLESFNAGKSFTVGVGLSVASGKPYTLTTGQDVYHTGLTNARPGGVTRNTLQGPAYMDLDMRVSRDFFLTKDKKEKGRVLTFALDAFNLPNHVNYVAYVGNASSPFFGHAVSAVAPRRLQLTSRFKF